MPPFYQTCFLLLLIVLVLPHVEPNLTNSPIFRTLCAVLVLIILVFMLIQQITLTAPLRLQ